MPVTTAKSGSAGENIHHYSHIRMRVVGEGNLKISLFSMDEVRTKVLPPLAMQPTTRIIPTKLTNFVEQRAGLKIETTELNEHFHITRIVLFTKEYGSEYPG